MNTLQLTPDWQLIRITYAIFATVYLLVWIHNSRILIRSLKHAGEFLVVALVVWLLWPVIMIGRLFV